MPITMPRMVKKALDLLALNPLMDDFKLCPMVIKNKLKKLFNKLFGFLAHFHGFIVLYFSVQNSDYPLGMFGGICFVGD